MAAIKTGPDRLWYYLTGATSDGGTQTDPDLSKGKFRAATLEYALGFARHQHHANLTLAFGSGITGRGKAILNAQEITDLVLTPPDSYSGDAVTIANGESKLIEGFDEDSFIRLSRTSADELHGAETVALLDVFNNVAGFDNIASAEALAGDDDCRCICLRNESGSAVTDLYAWIATLGDQQVSDAGQLGGAGAGTITTTGTFAGWPLVGWVRIETAAGVLREIAYYSERTDTILTVPAGGRAQLGTAAAAGAASDTIVAVPGLRIALEAPTAQPNGQFSDGTGGVPGGLSWYTAVQSADGPTVASLAAGNIYGLWLRRTIPAGAVAIPEAWQRVNLRFA